MKTRNHVLRKTALAAAVVLLVGGVSTTDSFTLGGTGSYAWVSSAYAAESGSGGGQKGAMGENRGGQGGQGGQGAAAKGQRGGKSVTDVLAEDGGDDSDRPGWAGTPGGEGRPGGGGNPSPGTTKGDDYGDLVLLLRDPVTGLPILAADGSLQVCTSPDCSTYTAMVDGEIPPGVTTYEVDFGRASVVRAPSGVVQHSLDEAISKLTADGTVIGLDPAGRLTFSVLVDGQWVTSTIDSPVENLALYIDLMTGLASDTVTTATEAALGDLATLNTAKSLLAAVADKTSDVSLDFVVIENELAGVVDKGEVYDLSSFLYTRNYDTVDYFFTMDGVKVEIGTLMINDYLQAINGDLPPADEYAALFAAATDDAVEIIELMHTQLFDLSATGELLPGTIQVQSP